MHVREFSIPVFELASKYGFFIPIMAYLQGHFFATIVSSFQKQNEGPSVPGFGKKEKKNF